MKIIQLFLMVLLAVLTGSSGSMAAVASDQDVQALTAGNNAFALEIYGKLKEGKGNLFCSPYGISSVMAMAYAGARGNTKAQMEQVLRLSQNGDNVHAAYREMTDSLGLTGNNESVGTKLINVLRRVKDAVLLRGWAAGHQLDIVNGLWVMKGFDVSKDYRNLMKTYYHAPAEEADFEKDGQSARRSINSWFRKAEPRQIQRGRGAGRYRFPDQAGLSQCDLLQRRVGMRNSRESTKGVPFTLLDGTKIKVPTMAQKHKFHYMETGGFKALKLPYKDSALSMIIFLPNAHDGLSEMEESLTIDKLEACLKAMNEHTVIVDLPRFKMDSKLDLAKVLQSMGMTDAFSLTQADFSGIDGKKDLYVGKVKQDAIVDVNEEGTEAFAVTIGQLRKTGRPSFKQFKADHPFFFMICRTNPTSILFMGRVVDPRK